MSFRRQRRVYFNNPEENVQSKLAQVNSHQQETDWSCSAACLKAAIEHIGEAISEADAIRAIGAREGRGAETTDIVTGARKLGYEASEGSFETLEKAKEALAEGWPIIADVQSFNYPGKGHYVVICGHKPGKGFIIMDPNTKGKTAVDNWRLLPDEKMEEVWWDRAMAPPHDLMPKWGVVVKPKQQEKIATGDMIEYLNKHPEKRREYEARQEAQKKYKNSVEGRKNQAAWRKRKATLSKKADAIPGGLYDKAKKKPHIPSDELKKGTKAELEHTTSHAIAEEIAKDHLVEDKKYYTKLDRMEKGSAGDILGMGAKRRAKAESARFAQNHYKYASAELDAFHDELNKIAESAIPTAARIGGWAGGAKGLWDGSKMNERGETHRLSETLTGAAKGAVIGAFLALGLERNAEGKSTLPNPSKAMNKSKGMANNLFKFLKSL